VATLSDTLLKGGVPATSVMLVFDTTDAPIPDTSGIHSSCRRTTTTHATTGVFTIVLSEGAWVMRWRIGRAWNEIDIQIPSGSATYDLVDVSGGSVDTIRTSYPLIPTIAAAKASIILGDRVDISSDGNGRPGTFRLDPTFTDLLDDASGFTDAAGSKFRRMQRE
jgi:hypothetical protein